MKNLKLAKSSYFPNLLKGGAKLMDALCSLVHDLQVDRDYTVSRFLDHSGSEDFIWAILKLLNFQNEKIAGNAAYVIGTIADTATGSERLVCIVQKSEVTGEKVLADLIRLLQFNDDEIILNGVGALGSFADSESGRYWLCNASQLDDLVVKICSLVCHKNVWIGSNSALLLARLTILDTGLSRILTHSNAREICTNLIVSLGSDAAGRGMNAAFALGRMVDVPGGQELISVVNEDLHKIMLKSLTKMFEDRDVGTAKNSLYALSCLAGQKPGSTILARYKAIEHCAKHLTDTLVNSMADAELRWFCAMTLRSLACQQKTCLELKKLHFVYNSCKTALRMEDLPDDIREEVIEVVEFLKPLPTIPSPRLQLLEALTIKVEWDEFKVRGPFTPKYSLFHSTEGSDYKIIYTGRSTSFVLKDLKPYTFNRFQMRLETDHEEGPMSSVASIRTEEWLPGQIRNLHMVANTLTQIKVAWDDPLDVNGVIRYYVIYLDDNSNRVGKTEERYYILQNLNQNSASDKAAYTVHVAAVTGRGEGVRMSLDVSTAEPGDCRPSKPAVSILGRSEVYVTWNPPTNSPGKIIRYELMANNEIVSSGTDCYATVSRLQADTEYIFCVVMFSNEGRFQSLTTKKTTPKDEFMSFSRTSSSKSRRASKSAKSKPEVDMTSTEVQTPEDVKENLEKTTEPHETFSSQPPRQTTPPKPISRSKTTICSRKSASLRRMTSLSQTRRNFPVPHTSQVTQPTTPVKPCSPGEQFVKRERSNTTGSNSKEETASASNSRLRRNRSMSIINKLLQSRAVKDVKQQQNDIRCSVVTLNLPEDVPSSYDFTNRWMHNRPDMISANLLPESNSSRNRSNTHFVEPLKRSTTILHSFSGPSALTPATPALGQRGLTIFTDTGREHSKEQPCRVISHHLPRDGSVRQNSYIGNSMPPRLCLPFSRQSKQLRNQYNVVTFLSP